jgi:glycosyltransferase involved in cell wall biosynthesis
MASRRSIVLVVPGPLDTRTGGYMYDKRVAEGLRACGWAVEVRELEGSFPHPAAASLTDAARVLSAIPDGGTVVIDGLALGAMPIQLERERSRLRIIALVHMSIAADVYLDSEKAARLAASERRALACVSLSIVTGERTASTLVSYGVAPDRILLVEPGTDPAPPARGSAAGPLQLLCVATLNCGKGHDVLFRALADVPQRNWRLTCAGSLQRHPETSERLRALLRTLQLQDRVSLAGELDDAALAECYHRADLFVLATRHETYGMAVAEALARGLPVISTSTGAIPQLVGDHAGLLVPPGDASALARAVSRVLGDDQLRARLASGARRAAERLPTWDTAVQKVSAALERVSAHGSFSL